MVTYREALSNGVRNVWCRVSESADNFWGRVGETVGRPPFPSAVLDLQEAIGRGAGTLNGLVCNRPDTPPPAPQFTGGQCPGTRYRGNCDYIFQGIGGPTPNSDQTVAVRGPISDLSVDGNILSITHATNDDGSGSATTTKELQFTDNAGDVLSVSALFLSVDSGPDDCGDPPVVVPPVSPENESMDEDYEDDDGVTRNINFPVNFGFAYINADVDLTIPFDVEVDADVKVNGTLNLQTGDVNFNFGGGRRPTSCSDDIGPDEEQIDIENPPPADPLRPRIVAVRTDCSVDINDAQVTRVFQEGIAPDIYIPRLLNIRFLCETTFGGDLRWTNEIPVKSLQAVTTCPVPWGAVRVAVNPVEGVTATAWQITRGLQDEEFPT